MGFERFEGIVRDMVFFFSVYFFKKTEEDWSVESERMFFLGFVEERIGDQERG